MYKLPTISNIVGMTPQQKDVEEFVPEDGKLPFTYQPGNTYGKGFPYAPELPKEPEKVDFSSGNRDFGQSEGGASVSDIFNMNKAPINRDNIYDLTQHILGSQSPYSPGSPPSGLDSKHWVRPPSENMTNKFFNKPFDEMNPREQTNFHAYYPNINAATDGMSSQEKRAYKQARYGYDNSAYFETRPETKKTWENMVGGYKPLAQRVAERDKDQD